MMNKVVRDIQKRIRQPSVVSSFNLLSINRRPTDVKVWEQPVLRNMEAPTASDVILTKSVSQTYGIGLTHTNIHYLQAP